MNDPKTPEKPTVDQPKPKPTEAHKPTEEIGGRAGPEPTRYGDWENGGRCTDF